MDFKMGQNTLACFPKREIIQSTAGESRRQQLKMGNEGEQGKVKRKSGKEDNEMKPVGQLESDWLEEKPT